MTELVLPGVFIEVRPEGLIVPGAITVGNLGVVGTAAKGPVGVPQLLGSYSDALARFGAYDPFDAENPNDPDKLTLTRALELAYRFGARTVWAVRAATDGGAAPVKAGLDLGSATGPNVRVEALTPGTWGNELTVAVSAGDANALVRAEEVAGTPPTLGHFPVLPSAVNRIVVRPAGGGADAVVPIVYGEAADPAPAPTQVRLTLSDGTLTFGTPPAAGATVVATYMVAKSAAVKVTVKLGVATEEVFSVVSGDDLVADLEASSALVRATALANAGEVLDTLPTTPLAGGTNGASGADYQTGLDALLEVDAHIIVGAGQDTSFGDNLALHCQNASGDDTKRERIAIVGTAAESDRAQFVQDTSAHTINSDRVVLVGPGITADDRSVSPVARVTLPGTYTAAAVAGLLSARPPHVSLTNSVLAVDGLEHTLSSAELKQLLLSRVLPVERRQGFRLVRGITTSTNTAWQQITTRRIVDYAKMGVRSAATPYIGSLNNERVRGRLRASINNVLYGMVLDEMLAPKDGYRLAVTATRDDEIRGIARVEIYLRPTFSIDFIVVTMFLE